MARHGLRDLVGGERLDRAQPFAHQLVRELPVPPQADQSAGELARLLGEDQVLPVGTGQPLRRDAARDHRDARRPGFEDLDPRSRAGAQRDGGGERAIEIRPHGRNAAFDRHVMRRERLDVERRIAPDDDEARAGEERAASGPDLLGQHHGRVRVGPPVERTHEHHVVTLSHQRGLGRRDGAGNHANTAGPHVAKRSGVLVRAGEYQVHVAGQLALELVDAARLPSQALALPPRRSIGEALMISASTLCASRTSRASGWSLLICGHVSAVCG